LLQWQHFGNWDLPISTHWLKDYPMHGRLLLLLSLVQHIWKKKVQLVEISMILFNIIYQNISKIIIYLAL
jgi:hypothetical protein